MIPPLWPWKVVALPLRGPRPTLKGEEPLGLRLMDDIMIDGTLAYGPFKPDRPPYASSTQPSSLAGQSAPMVGKAVRTSFVSPAKMPASAAAPEGTSRVTILVLKSKDVFQVTKYQIDAGVLTFEQPDGSKGAVDLSEVDWRKTSDMTAEARSGNLPQTAAQIH